MKAEPLKNKILKEQIEGGKWEQVKIVFTIPYVKASDIKSAVEWLKEKRYETDNSSVVDWNDVEEAFEDVMKK